MAPPPGFLSGNFHGQRSPAGYSAWGRKELDMNPLERARPIAAVVLQETAENSAEHTDKRVNPQRLTAD